MAFQHDLRKVLCSSLVLTTSHTYKSLTANERSAKWTKWPTRKVNTLYLISDHLCGLVIRVPGYRSRSPGFDSRRYQVFWEVVGLEWGPLSLVSTIEELLGRNSSDSGLENREYGHGDPLPWPRDTLYLQKLALTSPTSGGHSVGIVCLRTKITDYCYYYYYYIRDQKSH
jgi:hypothetical protein